jgi:Na+-driven multidrug efflux pump
MLKKIFILCSGADKNRKLLRRRATKFVGIGATVFFTAVMAFVAKRLCFIYCFGQYLSRCCIWLSMGSTNLDRFIVSTIRKRETKASDSSKQLLELS